MKIRRQKTRRFVYKNEVIAGLVIIIAALLVFFGVKSVVHTAASVVTLSAANVEVRQDADVPPIHVKATVDEKGAKRVLDKKSGYTVGDLVADFNKGKGCFAVYDGNVSEEGSYKIQVKLEDEVLEKLASDWKKKIEFQFQEATMTVKNKYGDWEGAKFKLLDGGYASGWLDIQKDTYYFGEDGNYVTGEYKVEERTYFFKEDGKFDVEKNPINPNHPVIALTFDDGPGPYTEKLLNALEEHEAKATFFMLGPRVKSYPEMLKKMLELGCELGNHSSNHPQFSKINAGEIAKEINAANEAIKKATGKTATVVRPPYGEITSVVRKTVKAPLILWSVDTLDWSSKNVEMIKKEIRANVKDGDVVLMHDIYETTVQAMIELLPEMKEEGYQFVTVSELAEFRGVDLKNGEKYRHFYK